ncbi:hypothetical protein [Streptomyces sp. NPDC026659]
MADRTAPHLHDEDMTITMREAESLSVGEKEWPGLALTRRV